MHKVLSKDALNLKVYKIASCADIAGNYFHHWINITCEKVAINGSNLKKLAPKNQIGESGGKRKKNYSANPELGRVRFWAESDHSFLSYLPLSDENFTLLNLNISEANWPISIKFYV